MSRKDAEAELERFLAGLPSFERKLLDWGVLSDAENEEWTRADWWWTPPGDAPIRARYEELLRQLPEKWREHKKNVLAVHRSLVPLPAGKPGRPRKDEEAELLAKVHRFRSRIAIPAPKRVNLGPGRHVKGLTFALRWRYVAPVASG